MKQVEDTQTKALEYFKSTRHIIVYYEDILKNHTVRHYCYRKAGTPLIVESFFCLNMGS